MRAYKNKLNETKGATSVLVIFMLLILSTMGVFAITSANANYKLSRRALDWNTMYYELDAQGEEYLYRLDGMLAAAESEVASAIAAGEDTDAEELYRQYALERLSELADDYPELDVYAPESGDPLYVSGKLWSGYPEMENCGLKITISIEPVFLAEAMTEESRPHGGMRYRVTQWSEFQAQEAGDEPDDGLFWDGTFSF